MSNMTLEQQVTEAFQILRKDLAKIVGSFDHQEVKDLEEQEEYIKEVIARGIELGHEPPLEAHHVGYYLYED